MPYKGGPTPLWKNVSQTWFTGLFAVSLVFFVVCMIEFVIIQTAFKGPQKKLMESGIENKYVCYENADFSFLVNIMSMAINFWYYSYLSNVPYASDRRWAQYMTLLAINIVV